MLLMRQSRSCPPPLPSSRTDDRLLARIPEYVTQDAGRGSGDKFRRILIDEGVTENLALQAVHTLTTGGELQGILATRVDFFLSSFLTVEGGQTVIRAHQHITASAQT